MPRQTLLDYELSGPTSYDISFRVDEDVAERLLDGLALLVREHAENIGFHDSAIYLMYEIASQIEGDMGLPPWMDSGTDDTVVIDLEVSMFEYWTLFDAIKEQLEVTMGPRNAREGMKLFLVWVDIVEQLYQQGANDGESVVGMLDDRSRLLYDRSGTERYSGEMVGRQQLLDGTVIERYRTPAGDTFYKCTECDTSYDSMWLEGHECP